MNFLEVKNLTKILNGKAVLSDISFSLPAAHIYGFIGRNGAGKTMLFRAVSGLIHPTSGEVWVQGKLLGRDLSFPQNIGLVIENIGLLPEFTGFKNLRMLSKIKNTLTDEQIRAAIVRVGLDPEDKRPVRKYSLGMKQRIVLAQALMESPDLLVLDEPTNALDQDGVELIRSILQEEKARSATILIASHSREDIDLLCDVIFRMDGGHISEIIHREEYIQGSGAI
ncbi:MAG: ABC transporter ATP-binding protein [Oscillospiraceae bacterium]|jgi:ABC-2 type transport system ATP-binding protein|nr:ABC transporter ATP-binding protein [Oscillospiraceae bacterium]